LRTAGGNITITTGAGGSFVANNLSSPAVQTRESGGNGNITITADYMDIRNGIDAGSGTVTLRTVTAGRTIGLGSPDAAGVLGLSDSELDLIRAGVLHIGGASAGDIEATGSLTPVNAGALVIQTPGTFSVNTGAVVEMAGGRTITVNAPTVILDGNLTATGGISGTATTVNVLGSAGGAQLQDAVDVAAAGALVNVAAGTYASLVINK